MDFEPLHKRGREMKQHTWLITGCLLGILIIGSAVNTQASSIQSADTEGTIHFSGRYEPIGTPDPPPTDSVKPPSGGTLPQTNTVTHYQWIWLGGLFTVLAVTIGIKRNTLNLKNERGNYT